MNVANLFEAGGGFKILQTTALSQTASMTLEPGGESSKKPNVHAKSDQILLVVEGAVLAEVEGKTRRLGPGDICLVPAGTPHRFENAGEKAARTFSVYSPPDYPAS